MIRYWVIEANMNAWGTKEDAWEAITFAAIDGIFIINRTKGDANINLKLILSYLRTVNPKWNKSYLRIREYVRKEPEAKP